jgi:hypothetical protein
MSVFWMESSRESHHYVNALQRLMAAAAREEAL